MDFTKVPHTMPRTEFEKEIRYFWAETGVKLKDLAEASSVSYLTMMDVARGRSVGHELKPKVRKFMTKYRAYLAKKQAS